MLKRKITKTLAIQIFIAIVSYFITISSARDFYYDEFGETGKDEIGCGLCKSHKSDEFIIAGFQMEFDPEYDTYMYFTRMKSNGEIYDPQKLWPHPDGEGGETYYYKAYTIKQIPNDRYVVCGWEQKKNETDKDKMNPFIMVLEENSSNDLNVIYYNWFYYDFANVRRAIDVIRTSDGGFVLVGEGDVDENTLYREAFIIKTYSNLNYRWGIHLGNHVGCSKAYSVAEAMIGSRRYYYVAGSKWYNSTGPWPESGHGGVLVARIRDYGSSGGFAGYRTFDVYPDRERMDVGWCIRRDVNDPNKMIIGGSAGFYQWGDDYYTFGKEWDDDCWMGWITLDLNQSGQINFWLDLNKFTLSAEMIKSIQPLSDGSIAFGGFWPRSNTTGAHDFDPLIGRLSDSWQNLYFLDIGDPPDYGDDDCFF